MHVKDGIGIREMFECIPASRIVTMANVYAVLVELKKREFDITQNKVSCPSLLNSTSMAGFFSKKQ